MWAFHKSVNFWYLVFLFLSFPEGAVGRTYFFIWLIFRKSTLVSLWKWIFRCHGKVRGIHGSLLKMCALNVAVQNMCLFAPAFLCSNICCCSSSSVLHTISSLYDFSKDYLITFLCFMCDKEFLILKFGDIILLICQTKFIKNFFAFCIFI